MQKEKLGWPASTNVSLGGLILGLVFLLDRLLKMLSLSGVSFWPGSRLVINHNVVSGLLAVSPIIFGLALVIIVILIYGAIKYPADRRWLACVIAGASSNIWDRLQYGGVIDYWTWASWPWVFNLADLMIIGGLIWYLIKSYLARR